MHNAFSKMVPGLRTGNAVFVVEHKKRDAGDLQSFGFIFVLFYFRQIRLFILDHFFHFLLIQSDIGGQCDKLVVVGKEFVFCETVNFSQLGARTKTRQRANDSSQVRSCG